MTYVSRATYYDHQRALMQKRPVPQAHESNEQVRDRVLDELQKLGMPTWGFWRFDVHYLPSLIHPDEHIHAVTYGKGTDGGGMLVATDRRVLYISKRPMFVKADELTYDVIGGVTYGDIGLQATIVLHSRLGDFKLRTFNLRLAQGFRDYIEQRCLEHLGSQNTNDPFN